MSYAVERGQVWMLGRHRLMCGDATNADDVAKLTEGKTLDVTLTDPPYGVNIVNVKTNMSGNECTPPPGQDRRNREPGTRRGLVVSESFTQRTKLPGLEKRGKLPPPTL